MNIEEVFETLFVMFPKNANCEIEGRTIRLGLVCEIFDWREIDKQYDQDVFPFSIETSIIPHPLELTSKIMEQALRGVKVVRDEFVAAAEVYQYAGGIPVDMESVQTKEPKESSIVSEIRTLRHHLGKTIKVRHFASLEDAQAFIRQVISLRAVTLFGLVGFYLDHQMNRIGNTGWDLLEEQVAGKDRFAVLAK